MSSTYRKRRFVESVFELMRRMIRGFIACVGGIKQIKIFVLYNSPRFMRTSFWRWYGLDKCADEYVDFLPAHLLSAVNNLQENGIAELQSISSDVIDEFLESNALLVSKNWFCNCDFMDPFFQQVLSDTQLVELVSAYYRRPAFFREEPTLNVLNKTDPALANKPSRVFHSDGYRQVSMMLLLNDISADDIHMEYCLSSHIDQQQSYDRRLLDQEIIDKRYPRKSLVGKRGTVFVFDTEGFHKGFYELEKEGTVEYRAILHVNMHPGIYRKLNRYGLRE